MEGSSPLNKRDGRAGKELNKMIQQRFRMIGSYAEGARLHRGRYDKGAADHEVGAKHLDRYGGRWVRSLRGVELAFTPG